MSSDEPSGLIALVAYGAADYTFNSDPHSSLYDKAIKRVGRSTFTYSTIVGQTDDEMTYVFQLNKLNVDRSQTEAIFDLVGDCYLSFKTIDIGYDVIEQCTIEYKHIKDTDTWTPIEKLKSHTFELFAAIKPCDFMIRHDKNETTIPIPFFFTHSTENYLPMVNQMLFRIRCKLNRKLTNVELTHKAVYLDICERKRMLNMYSEMYRKLQCFSTTYESCACAPFDTIKLNMNHHQVRDIHVIVEDMTDPRKRFIVPEIKLSLNGHTHYKLNSLMSTNIIPAKYYGICDNTCRLHCIPFCENPSGYDYTSTVNFAIIDHANIHFSGLDDCNKTYRVIIIARHFNIMQFMKGMCGLLFYEDPYHNSINNRKI